MTISVGDTIPSIPLVKVTPDGPDTVSSQDYFAGRTIALFAVPGAFTPTCSARHLPGFVEHKDAILAKGVDEIACTSVNDAFVMAAWSKTAGAEGITMLADGNAAFAEALGLAIDASKFGMGTRSARYAMLVEDGVVKQLHVEAPGEFKVSSAEHLLSEM
ncbi:MULTISPECIES: peroxiredoxin [Sphingomonas]|jgi:glutaredoxin/glutathione-dependent peroxiredoxin|uniref:peroxiredoxin n=1 Tax=Sphingomonas TaxID=13687 RepID=UPI00193BE356|nr:MULTISPECIES: peroxiredoxin [Sphingomonas]